MFKKVEAIQDIDTSKLVQKLITMQKIKILTMKIPDHSVYITTSNFNNFFSTLSGFKQKEAKVSTNKDLNAVEQHANHNK